MSDIPTGGSAPQAVQVPSHGHCEICARPIKQGERFCGSAECNERHQQNIAEKKKAMWKMIAIMLGLILVFTVLNRTNWIV